MSTFGGPNDTGVAPDEDLAIIGVSDLQKFSYLFLAQQPPGTTGLARRLNPDSLYLACRWDYTTTPKSYLKTIKVKVANLSSGKSADAQPVDWGPDLTTGRITDLSPGLATVLGLQTDDTCQIQIPLPNVGQSGT
jgi:hypothetical protein